QSGWEQAAAVLASAQAAVKAGGMMLEYPWDLVRQNAAMLREDFRLVAARTPFTPPAQGATIGPAENFYVPASARLEPLVVLDATEGPITVGPGAVLEAFTRIAGPCHIGHGSRLVSANVRGGTTIGPQCRVGGEVETSILHGYANKYHVGFLGHSYI